MRWGRLRVWKINAKSMSTERSFNVPVDHAYLHAYQKLDVDSWFETRPAGDGGIFMLLAGCFGEPRNGAGLIQQRSYGWC